MKLQDGRTMDLTLTANQAVGDFVTVGDMTARIISKSSDTKGIGVISGVHLAVKAAGTAFAQGANCWLSATKNTFTTNKGSLKGRAVVFEAAANADTTVKVLLNGLADTPA